MGNRYISLSNRLFRIHVEIYHTETSPPFANERDFLNKALLRDIRERDEITAKFSP